MNVKNIMVLLCLCLLPSCMVKKYPKIQLCSTVSLLDICEAIPSSTVQMKEQMRAALHFAQQQAAQIAYIPAAKRTYYNTVQALDTVCLKLSITAQKAALLHKVHSDALMRTVAYDVSRQVDGALQAFKRRVDLQKAVQEYQEFGSDSFVKKTFVKKWMNAWKEFGDKKGRQLSVEDQNLVYRLEQKVQKLSEQILASMQMQEESVALLPEQVAGVDQRIVDTWTVNAQHAYCVPLQVDSYDAIMQQAHDDHVRKDFFATYFNQGYPLIAHVLQEYMRLEYERAQLLGYSSSAQLQVQGTYAGTVRGAQKIISSVGASLSPWRQETYKQLQALMPQYFDKKHNIAMWDEAFVKAQLQKYRYQVDRFSARDYFELHDTFQKMLQLCGVWAGVYFEKVSIPEQACLWSPEIEIYKVRDTQTKQIRGYIFFDLFMRPGKSKGQELHGIMPTVLDDCTVPCVGAYAVLADFQKEKSEELVLLSLDQVGMLFHEMGHALHAMLNVQPLYTISGLHVEHDTRDIPAVLFEMLVYTPQVLAFLAQHYATKQPLSPQRIKQLVASERFGRLCRLQKQLFLSDFALHITQQKNVDFEKTARMVYKKYFPHTHWSPDFHFYTQWPHLTDNVALYYRYVLAQVVALQSIAKIQKKMDIFDKQFAQWLQRFILGPEIHMHPGKWITKAVGNLQYSCVVDEA